MLTRQLLGTYEGTHKRRLPTFEMSDRNKFGIPIHETYTTRSLREAKSGICTDNHLRGYAWSSGLPLDSWVLMDGKRTRDIRVLRLGRGSGSPDSCDAKRGEKEF